MRFVTSSWILVVGTATACMASEAKHPPTVRRDSAGVTITDNTRSLWDEDSRWHLSPSPTLSIGGIGNGPEHELYRVNGALVVAGDQVVVANHGSLEIRFYERDGGRHLRTVGGKGEGPGEFRGVSWINLFADDSLLVWDQHLNRGTVLTSDGEFARSMKLDDPNCVAVLAFGHGSVLGREMTYVGMREAHDGVIRPRRPMRYYRYSTQGAMLNPVGSFPWNERWIKLEEHLHQSERVFGMKTVIAARDSVLWIGTGESFVIDGYNQAGKLLKRTSFLGHESARVEEHAVDMWKEEKLASYPTEGSREHLRPFVEGMVPPTTIPPYDRLVIDATGNLWVETYRVPGEEVHTWIVFTAEGVMLGSLMVPGGFYVMDVGEDYVLGVSQDDMDVEYVELYKLVKPDALDRSG